MSGFLSVVIFVFAAILASIAVACWQKGGYANYWYALWWGIAAYFCVGMGSGFTYYYYVIKPSQESAEVEKAPTPIPISVADRPWLSVEVAPAGPLVFDGDNVHLRVAYQVRNTGRSVAVGVTINAAVVVPQDMNAYFKEPIERQKRLCENVTSGVNSTTIFMDKPLVSVVGYGLRRQDMESRRIGDSDMAILMIVGCVDYQFVDRSSHHQTGFIYEVNELDPEKGPAHPLAITIGKNVPADRLVLTKFPVGGDYAN